MGSVADKKEYLLETKELIRQAIIDKGVNVPESASFREYAGKIENVSGDSLIVNGGVEESLPFGETLSKGDLFKGVYTKTPCVMKATNIDLSEPMYSTRICTATSATDDGILLVAGETRFSAPEYSGGKGRINLFKYTQENNTVIFSKINDPEIDAINTALLGDDDYGTGMKTCLLSGNGKYLFVYYTVWHSGLPSEDFAYIYKNNNGKFIFLCSLDEIMIANFGIKKCTWSEDGDILVISRTQNLNSAYVDPYSDNEALFIYRNISDSFIRIQNPTNISDVTNAIIAAEVSLNKQSLVVIRTVSPYIFMYKLTLDDYNYVLDNDFIIPSTPSSQLSDIFISSDGKRIVGKLSNREIIAYIRNSENTVQLLTINGMSMNYIDVSCNFSKDDKYAFISTPVNNSYRVLMYNDDNENPSYDVVDSFVGVKSWASHGLFLFDSKYVLVTMQYASDTETRVVLLQRNIVMHKSKNQIADILNAAKTGVVLENGDTGQTKKVLTLWQ